MECLYKVWRAYYLLLFYDQIMLLYSGFLVAMACVTVYIILLLEMSVSNSKLVSVFETCCCFWVGFFNFYFVNVFLLILCNEIAQCFYSTEVIEIVKSCISYNMKQIEFLNVLTFNQYCEIFIHSW